MSFYKNINFTDCAFAIKNKKINFSYNLENQPSMKKENLYLSFAIFITALVYWSSLSNGFTNFDDDIGVTVNMSIRTLDFESLKAQFSNFTLGMYMPLTMSVYMMIYKFFTYNPMAYHALQLLLHLINVVLVFRWILKIKYPTEVALFTALAFALHPLQVESVSWVAALSTPLFACFFLLTLHRWVDYRAGRGKNHYFWALLFMLLACISKSAAVTITPVLFLVDYFLHQKWTDKKSLLEKIPFLSLSFFFGILTFYSRNSSGHNLTLDTPFHLFDRLLMICETIVFYWVRLLLPANQNLWYPFYKTDGSWSIDFYLAPLLLLSIGYFIWKKAQNWQHLLIFGLLFYLFIIGLSLPITRVGNFEMRNDRYNYLPMIGFFFVIGVYLHHFWRDKKMTFVLPLAAVWLAFLGFQTYQRTKVWKDSKTLFSDFIEKNKVEPIPFYNRGLAYLYEEDYARAKADFEAVKRINPDYYGNEYRLGICHLQQNNFEIAIKNFDKAILQDGNYAKAHRSRGFCKYKMGDFNGAIVDLEKAKNLDPKDAEAAYNLGLAYGAAQQLPQAAQYYETAIALNPKYVEAMINLGNIAAMSGNFEAALMRYNQAIALNQTFPNAYLSRGKIFFDKKMYEQAKSDFNRCLQLNPNDPRPRQLLAQMQ
jgi:protein O-mannosyl-transferase